MNKKKFRANLYQTYIASGMSDPVLIQEHIKIAESFVFQDMIVSGERLDAMDQTIKAVCDKTLAGTEACKTRQDLLQTVLNDPLRRRLRTYKSQLLAYTESISAIQ